MDFSLTSDQHELRDLARRIFDDTCTHDHLAAMSASAREFGAGTDLALWRTLADAGLVGIALPEADGGAGLGWLDAVIVISEAARAAAPIPALATIALAAPTLPSGHPLVRKIGDGTSIVVGAIHESHGHTDLQTTAVDGGLTGIKTNVGHGLVADHFLVAARDGVYLVAADDPGVTATRQDTTSGIPEALVELRDARAEQIGDRDAVDDMIRRGQVAAAVMTAAACERAVELTAAYVVERHQFGRPLAALQAVSQRSGDMYIDTEVVRLTAWQAAFRLDQGLPADHAIASAKFWAADGGWRVVNSALHLHGGVGADRDYPLHRYFLMLKQLELLLGAATPTLAALGALIADGQPAD